MAGVLHAYAAVAIHLKSHQAIGKAGLVLQEHCSADFVLAHIRGGCQAEKAAYKTLSTAQMQ